MLATMQMAANTALTNAGMADLGKWSSLELQMLRRTPPRGTDATLQRSGIAAMQPSNYSATQASTTIRRVFFDKLTAGHTARYVGHGQGHMLGGKPRGQLTSWQQRIPTLLVPASTKRKKQTRQPCRHAYKLISHHNRSKCPQQQHRATVYHTSPPFLATALAIQQPFASALSCLVAISPAAQWHAIRATHAMPNAVQPSLSAWSQRSKKC